MLPQLAKNVNMCKSTGTLSDLFPRVLLTDVIAGVNFLDNKTSDLTFDKFWIFSAVIKNSALSH